MRSFTCEICDKPFPVALLNEHHKKPQSLGGADTPDNIANLCSGCHQSLHSIAFMLLNPKRRHEVDPSAVALFPQNQNARSKIIRLAALVAREMALKKEIRKAPNEEIKAIVELPSRYMELLRLSGYDMPNRTGKPAGVSRVIRQIVAKFLIHRFPSHASEIQDLLRKSPVAPTVNEPADES